MSAILNRSRLGPAPASARHAGPASRVAAALGAVVERLLEWQERAAQRRHLAGLDERMLRDVGLTRADVFAEYRKLPWQA